MRKLLRYYWGAALPGACPRWLSALQGGEEHTNLRSCQIFRVPQNAPACAGSKDPDSCGQPARGCQQLPAAAGILRAAAGSLPAPARNSRQTAGSWLPDRKSDASLSLKSDVRDVSSFRTSHFRLTSDFRLQTPFRLQRPSAAGSCPAACRELPGRLQAAAPKVLIGPVGFSNVKSPHDSQFCFSNTFFINSCQVFL